MESTPSFDPDRVIDVTSREVHKTPGGADTTPPTPPPAPGAGGRGTGGPVPPFKYPHGPGEAGDPGDPTTPIPPVAPESDGSAERRSRIASHLGNFAVKSGGVMLETLKKGYENAKVVGKAVYKFSKERVQGTVELSSIAITGTHKAILKSRRNTIREEEHKARISSAVRKETAKAVIEGRYPDDDLAPVTKSERRVGVKTAKRGHKIAKKAYEKQRLEMALGVPVKTTVPNPKAIQRNQPDTVTVTAKDSRGEPIFDLSTPAGKARRQTSRYPAARVRAESKSARRYGMHDRAQQDLLEKQQAVVNGVDRKGRRKSKAGGSQSKAVKLDQKIQRASDKLELKKRNRRNRLIARRLP